ncbi:hypothetical protein [Acinetobacter pittii]|uniref:hypothetical protein n=1 Tax=Acinetobacter pittii TaxID=48296 RepID=UPI002DBA1F86|nr:hypothetical protein [Acinetobacter pittii]MEB7642925.1 hypothetical protein [Acinetobacter pittii]
MTLTPSEKLMRDNKVAVIAGHYCVSPDLEDLSNNGEAEELSFSKGIEMVTKINKKGLSATLCLWVNDIGIPSDQRALMKDNYRIPNNYSRLLEHSDITESDVLVLFESSARNKASTLLKKLTKNQPSLFRRHDSSDNDLIRCIEGTMCDISTGRNAYVIDGPEGENLVVKEGPNPKCNLILATLFLTLRQQYKFDSTINIFNDIYINRIRLGLHVYNKLFSKENPMIFDNYFCSDSHIKQDNFNQGAIE